MNIDKRTLREVAEKATPGPWKVFSDIDTKTFSIHTREISAVKTLLSGVGLIVSRMLRPTLNLLLHLTRKSRWRCWMNWSITNHAKSELQSWFWTTRQAGMLSTRSWKPQRST